MSAPTVTTEAPIVSSAEITVKTEAQTIAGDETREIAQKMPWQPGAIPKKVTFGPKIKESKMRFKGKASPVSKESVEKAFKILQQQHKALEHNDEVLQLGQVRLNQGQEKLQWGQGRLWQEMKEMPQLIMKLKELMSSSVSESSPASPPRLF